MGVVWGGLFFGGGGFGFEGAFWVIGFASFGEFRK